MLQNKNRIGNFTSSEIVALTKSGKEKNSYGAPFYTYIEECNMERRLGRALESEQDGRPTTWGNLAEIRTFDILGTEYQYLAKETLLHPEINYWAGSPDGKKEDKGKTALSIKCPFSLKSFCQLVDCIHTTSTGLEAMHLIRIKHKDGEKFYWQLVSDSILLGAKYGELVIYCPYKSEIQSIRDIAQEKNISWIFWALEEELPYLLDNGYYKNINTICFEVPQEDKQLLTERVIEAGKKLINTPQLTLTTDK